MPEGVDVEPACALLIEAEQVQRGEIASGIVEEEVFAARVAGVDPAIVRAGVPFVDGGVVLNAGISAAPGSEGNLVPEFASRNVLRGRGSRASRRAFSSSVRQ